MPERDIFVTEDDARKLRTLLVGVRERSVRDREHLQQLDDELDRARVVPASEMPADVVTMNSELALRDLDTGEEMVFTVVFPSEANADQHRISVLAPLGTAARPKPPPSRSAFRSTNTSAARTPTPCRCR